MAFSVNSTAMVRPSGDQPERPETLSRWSAAAGVRPRRGDIELQLTRLDGVGQERNPAAVRGPGHTAFRARRARSRSRDASWCASALTPATRIALRPFGAPSLPASVSTHATRVPSGEIAACSNRCAASSECTPSSSADTVAAAFRDGRP